MRRSWVLEHELVIEEQCEVNKVTGRVKEHDCRMNWGGSSKTVESDFENDMLVSGTTENARI